MSRFEGVSDTLFIPLTARIYMSRRFPEYFYDAKALELSSELPDGSIEQNSNEYSMVASVARYYHLDRMVKAFISCHPNANIVNLGCGLETAYFRIPERKQAIFYEVDLPAVIEGRRQVLGEQPGEKLIPGDLFDLEWAKEIKDVTLPTLMVVSGVFQYFHEEDVLSFVEKAKGVFPDAELVFDATNSTGIKYAEKYVKKTGNTSAMMYFYVNKPEDFARKAGVRLLDCINFFPEARRMIGRKTGLYTRIAMKVCDDLGRAKLVRVKLG